MNGHVQLNTTIGYQDSLWGLPPWRERKPNQNKTQTTTKPETRYTSAQDG